MKSSQQHFFDRLIGIMAQLRGPSGCLWDKEQTHDSLKRYLVEEAYEVIDAIDRNDFSHLQEELGDLLLQVVFHAQIAQEENRFDIDDILSGLISKLERRHPHIFSNLKVSSSKEIKEHWETIKQEEKKGSKLAGTPKSLPALLYALAIQQKTSVTGFDWESQEDIFEKLTEEFEEFKKACQTGVNVEEEVGDLLFTMVNISRHFEIDPEVALRKVVNKFCQRFESMEKQARERGQIFETLSLAEKDKLWEQAKKEEKAE